MPMDFNPTDRGSRIEVADALRSDSLAVDVLRKDGLPVIAEISYTFASWAVRDCPGHWRRTSAGELSWVDGSLRPEDAIFEDVLGNFAAAVPSANTGSLQDRAGLTP